MGSGRSAALILACFAAAAASALPPDPAELRRHMISLGNDGRLQATGEWAQSPDELRGIILDQVPAAGAAVVAEAPPRVFVYAHGGLVHEESGLRRVPLFDDLFAGTGVYPLVFVWRTGPWETLRGFFADLMGRARSLAAADPEAGTEGWFDRTVERLARALGGTLAWGEIKENAARASQADGGAAQAAAALAELVAARPGTSIHLAGHSAGSILLAGLVERLGPGTPIASVTLMAPACTVALFKASYLPALRAGRIGALRVFVLDDAHEQDDTVSWYGQSILYLIRNALEDEVPTALLGMETAWAADPELAALAAAGRVELVRTPNLEPVGSRHASRAGTHADFEWDEAMLQALKAGARAPREAAAAE